MSKHLFLLLLLDTLLSCQRDNETKTGFTEMEVPVFNTHILKASVFLENNSNYLLVFESGLGDDYSVWNEKNVASCLADSMDVVMYNRAGYGNSTIDTTPRTIENLQMELGKVINQASNGRKVILVGHSLGGLIIRDYAIKNPSAVAALLFVDPTHEDFNQPTQEQEDEIYSAFYQLYGESFGGTREAKELREDVSYSNQLGNLPDMAVTVLTSMKQDAANNAADAANSKTRQDWFNAHETLGSGITDFVHIQTLNSGHYIMLEEPELVILQIRNLISKLP